MLKKENIKLAIFGAGRWGINHVKTAASILPSENIYVFDSNPETELKVKSINNQITFISYPGTGNQYQETSNQHPVFSAAIIATPAETHFQLAIQLLESGKHVLVEKPITLKADEAKHLLNLAIDRNLILMVGHVLLFHPAVMKMKEEIVNGTIGKLQYIYSNRLNLGAIRTEENSLWSFAPHDISIIQYLVGGQPDEVIANGGAFVQEGIEDSTLTFLSYPGNIKAHIFVSWLHPFKEQRMVVIGDKGMFVFEDSLKTEKLKFYKKGFEFKNGAIEKFESEYEVIEFPNKMPLQEEHLHFYDCVLNNKQPLTDGKHAWEVLQILEQATATLKRL